MNNKKADSDIVLKNNLVYITRAFFTENFFLKSRDEDQDNEVIGINSSLLQSTE